MLLAVIAMLSMPSANASQRRDHRCIDRGTRTVLTGREVGVYRTARGAARHHGGWYGCRFTTGRRTVLFHYQFEHGRLLRIAGRYIAYTAPSLPYPEDPDVEPAAVIAYDLGHPKVRLSWRSCHADPWSGSLPAPPNCATKGADPVTALVIAPNGALVWIARPARAGEDYEVIATAPGQGTRLLDHGPAIGPRSLTRHGFTATWTNHGEPRTANLR